MRMRNMSVRTAVMMIVLSGLVIALMGSLFTAFAENKDLDVDYTDDLAGYCRAVAELNRLPSSNMRKAAPVPKYLVMCRTRGQDISYTTTEPTQIVKGPDNRCILAYDSWEKAEEAINWLRSQDDVRYAEHDSEVTASGEGNSTVSFRSVGATQLNLGGLLSLAQRYGNGSQTVAVIDSGVCNHSLLSGRMKSKGYDYVDADTDPTNDLSGHGTHVAGIIVDCTADVPVWIYPVRVLNSSGTGQMSNVVSAVLEATDANVDVINLSLESFEMSDALDDAIEAAVDHGVTVVIAAGNHSCDTSEVCPAHLTGEGIIVVGSVEASNGGYHRADYSNYGNSVDLYAFGSSIESCSRSGGYVVQSGTSMAAAHVSGVCALIGLIQKASSPQKIERRLRSVCKGTALPVLDTTGFVPASEGFYLTNIQLCVGDTLQLPVAAVPKTSQAVITWSSTDDSVLTIDDGLLKAKRAGAVELRASCLGFEESHITVTVSDKASSIVMLPSGLTALSDEAMVGTGCTSIVLQEGVETIGDKAFANCNYLQTLLLPDSLIEIGESILDQSTQAIIICNANSTGLAYAKDHGLQYVILAE